MAIRKLQAATLALFGGLLLAAPARADWTAYGGSPEHQFFTTEKLTAPLGVVWKHATTLVADRGGNKGGPVITGGVVYFPSKNRLYAVDAATGELKWRVPEGDATDRNIPSITATPVVDGERVYVPAADGTLTAFNVTDGSQSWTFRTGAAIHSSPTLVGDVLYFGSDDDYVYAVDARQGTLRWKSNERNKSIPLTDDAVGSPVYYNGVIYINSSDMKLWALAADTGKVVWSQRMIAPSQDISPVAFNGKIYMAAGSTIYQFRLRGGISRPFPLQQWVENDISTTPIITEKAWYFGDRNGYFHAFTTAGRPALNAEGQPWKLKLEGKPQGTPIMTADTLFVSTDKGFIYGIDLDKGKITWTYRTEAPKGIEPLYSYYAIRAPLAVSNSRLFVLGDDGTLTCMGNEASDDEGPIITAPRPSRGAVMNGSPPLYVATYLWDEGTGINPDTIELLLDGVPIDPYKEAPRDAKRDPYKPVPPPPANKGWTYDPMKRLLTYSTPKAEEGQKEQALIDGVHRVQVQAADWRGNFTSLEWTFVVDHTLPRGAVATKPKAVPKGQPGQPGAPGGYPGAEDSGAGGYPPGYMQQGAPGMQGPGMQGQQGNGRGQTFRGRFGGYQYNNRGGAGYGRGGAGGSGGQYGGFGRGNTGRGGAGGRRFGN